MNKMTQMQKDILQLQHDIRRLEAMFQELLAKLAMLEAIAIRALH